MKNVLTYIQTTCILHLDFIERCCIMTAETKREKFVRLAEARTNKILEMMRLLGNCSSKTNYDFNEEDIKKIFAALDKELKNSKNRFLGLDSKEEKFTLN